MRKLAVLALIAALSGCTSKTQYGYCVGAFDARDPHLVYRLSVANVAIGIFFFEFIVPPVAVVANETFCPVGRVD